MILGAAAQLQALAGRNDTPARLIKETDEALSQILEDIRALVARGEVRISVHGYEELAADQVLVHEVVNGLAAAVLVEDHPEFPKGPCVLVLEQDTAGKPVHVVWGIAHGQTSPAVWVTAYRPDPAK